jgi:hypothetical protein
MSKKITHTNLYEKCFCDEAGKLTLAQSPNLPLIVWLLSAILLFILKDQSGSLIKSLQILNTGAIFTWAWLELFAGTNYFRRALGFGVLLTILLAR